MKEPNRGDMRRDGGACGRLFRGNTVVPDELGRRSSHWSRSLALATVMVAAACVASAQISIPASGIINTVAGLGTFTGDNGPASSAQLNTPFGVVLDPAGNYYIADTYNNRIRKVTMSSGIIVTLAGNGAAGYSGDSGLATSAQLNNPSAVALDSAGNVYIADSGNNRVRKITVSTGIITTVAGNGIAGYSGDEAAATDAELSYPSGVALDSAGNLYIADLENSVIRKVSTSSGIITTVAGNGAVGYSGDGGPATTAELSYPNAVALDASGNIYIADTDNNCIRKVTVSTGVITTVAGNGAAGYSGDGGAATSAELDYPEAVALDSTGNLYIADSGNHRIRKVTISTGVMSTVAGTGWPAYCCDGGPALDAELHFPSGIAVDTAGNLYIADTDNNRIRKVIVSSSIINTIAGIDAYAGDGGPATSALLNSPTGIVADPSGNLYIADDGNCRVRKVTASTGTITTYAGNGTGCFDTGGDDGGDGGAATNAQLGNTSGVALDSAGNLYIAAGNNIRKVTALTSIITTVAGSYLHGYAGDGGPATSAQLSYPEAVAVDSAGNLYIADTDNNRVRKVTVSTGIITTVAGNGTAGYSGDGVAATSTELNGPFGVALDGAGNIYIADIGNNRIRKVTVSTGLISTVAGNGNCAFSGDGGLATNAALCGPGDVKLDSAGNLYIADSDNSGIRKVTAATGIITTLSGNGLYGYSGDGGLAIDAELDYPIAVAVNSAGDLYIADLDNGRIRAVGPIKTTPTVTWPTPANLGYGTPLSATQLDATASVAGTFVYSPATGTILAPGTYTLTVTFTPTDTVDYTGASKTVSLTVSKAAPVITWATPAGITYGTALSATQLDATASVAGTFVYSPAAGTIPAGGSDTLSVTFTPTNSTDYATVSKTVSLAVSKAAPVVTWSTPATITYGTALSTTQLNATASVAGTFVYSPAAGIIPAAGSDTLTVTFTPTNSTDYTTASQMVSLTVSKAAPDITWPTPAAITYGTALSTTQLDATASVAGTLVYSPAAGTILAAGSDTLSVTFTPTNSTDYTTVSKTVLLAVNKATPVITWATPAPILKGTALSAAQLDATASVPGTFVYSPAAGSTPAAGIDTLTATFTPTNTADYASPAPATVSLTVLAETITLSSTSGITGSVLIITGSNFGSTQGTSTVTFGGVAATVSSWTSSSISVTVPASLAPGSYEVSVNIGGIPIGEALFVVPPPTISNLSINQGPVGMGIVITGVAFGNAQGTSTVTIGNALAQSQWSIVNNTGQITAQVPALAAGIVNIVVTVNGVSSAPYQFTVDSAFGCN